jgi:hypothetical protein
MIGDYVDDRNKDRENREHTNAKRQPGHPPPILFLLGRLCIGSLKISDQGDKGSTEEKQRKEMPYFAGQKMFADELHGWVLILA